MSFIYLETSPHPVGQDGPHTQDLPALASCVLGLACTCTHCLYGARVLGYGSVPVHTILTEPVCWDYECVLYTPSLKSLCAGLWACACTHCFYGACVLDYGCVPVHTILTEQASSPLAPAMQLPWFCFLQS